MKYRCNGCRQDVEAKDFTGGNCIKCQVKIDSYDSLLELKNSLEEKLRPCTILDSLVGQIVRKMYERGELSPMQAGQLGFSPFVKDVLFPETRKETWGEKTVRLGKIAEEQRINLNNLMRNAQEKIITNPDGPIFKKAQEMLSKTTFPTGVKNPLVKNIIDLPGVGTAPDPSLSMDEGEMAARENSGIKKEIKHPMSKAERYLLDVLDGVYYASIIVSETGMNYDKAEEIMDFVKELRSRE